MFYSCMEGLHEYFMTFRTSRLEKRENQNEAPHKLMQVVMFLDINWITELNNEIVWYSLNWNNIIIIVIFSLL